MARYIAQQTKKDVSELPYQILALRRIRQATFFTQLMEIMDAAVALKLPTNWGKVWFLMPKGSTQTRLNNIQKSQLTQPSKNVLMTNVS